MYVVLMARLSLACLVKCVQSEITRGLEPIHSQRVSTATTFNFFNIPFLEQIFSLGLM